MTAKAVTTLVCFIGLLPCLWFIIGYWIVTGGKWVREEAGQFLMAITGTVGGMFAFSIAYSWAAAEWLRWVSVALFIAFIAEMWWPLRLLWLAQREKATKAQSELQDQQPETIEK